MNTENINIEDIKVGEMYNVRVKVSIMNTAGVFCYACDKDGAYLGKHPNLFTEDEAEAFSPIIPENGTKNTETAPKYDPCRLFRKGDKVRVVEWNGRLMFNEHGKVFECTENEHKNGLVPLKMNEDDITHLVHVCHLELVTPIEELEPYNVKFLQSGEIPDTYYYWAVMDNMGNEVARFWHEQYEKGQAKAAAEAECARLNAEHRKETQQ